MLERLKMLEGAKVYDLAQPLEQGMPQSPNHPSFRMALARRHGDQVRPDGGSAANEIVVTGGHVGTHVDALAHVSHNGLLFGGIDAAEAQRGGRFNALGVHTIAPFLCRGVLLDVAGHKGVDVLPAEYPVTAADLEATAAAQGTAIQAGDAVLIRTGWARHWSNVAAFVGHESGVPGPDEGAARWLSRFQIRLSGSDTIAYEVIPAGAGHRVLPVHRIFLVEQGIHIMEVLQLEDLARDKQYEFIFMAAPLKMTGATGSPIRPLAIV